MVADSAKKADDYVLIVDDDEDAREILHRIVTAMGFETQMAEDGEEALKRVKQGNPRLILLDLMMPRMDGYGVVFNLMRNPATRHIPVIVVSAYSVGQEDLLRLPGVTAVMQKGKMRDIFKVISETLGNPVSGPKQKHQLVTHR